MGCVTEYAAQPYALCNDAYAQCISQYCCLRPISPACFLNVLSLAPLFFRIIVLASCPGTLETLRRIRWELHLEQVNVDQTWRLRDQVVLGQHLKEVTVWNAFECVGKAIETLGIRSFVRDINVNTKMFPEFYVRHERKQQSFDAQPIRDARRHTAPTLELWMQQEYQTTIVTTMVAQLRVAMRGRSMTRSGMFTTFIVPNIYLLSVLLQTVYAGRLRAQDSVNSTCVS